MWDGITEAGALKKMAKISCQMVKNYAWDRSLSNLSQGKFLSMPENECYNSDYPTIGSHSSLESKFIFQSTVYVTNKSIRNRRVSLVYTYGNYSKASRVILQLA